jgi:flagellar assembly protein FliH
MNLSKVIDSKAAALVQPWRFPELHDPAPPPPPENPKPKPETESVSLLTAEKIAEIQAQAHQEGFDQGRREGREAGAADIRLKMAQFDTLMAALTKPFEHLDAQVEQELISIVKALTAVLLHREIETDPHTLIPVVREAMASLPVAAREVKVHLHPNDATMIRESLSQSDEDRSWKIIEDPVLRRGDCRVVSNTSQIDATLQARLTALLDSVFHAEVARAEDQPS